MNRLLFVFAIFLSHIIQGITGFAGTVLAVPVGIYLVGLSSSIAVMNVVGIAVSVQICVVAKKHLRPAILRKALAIMLPGVVAGFFLVDVLRDYENIQRMILGIFVTTIGLVNLIKGKRKLPVPGGEALLGGLLFIGGIFHGMFVCGGTLVVVYFSNKIAGKDAFRANVSAMWLVLNTIVMLMHAYNGYFDRETMLLAAVSIPVVFASAAIGGWLLARMSQEFFIRLTNVLLAVTGAALLANTLF